jgi:hypothetical protein
MQLKKLHLNEVREKISASSINFSNKSEWTFMDGSCDEGGKVNFSIFLQKAFTKISFTFTMMFAC